jgi:transporter family-2 protein
MSNTAYALIMLAAGVGIPVLAAANAALGTRLGSPTAAAVIAFAVALLCALIVLVVIKSGDIAPAIQNLKGAHPKLFIAGLFVCFYVLSITFVAPHFGVGNAVFFVLLGQLASAALIDHFGLFGAQVSPVSLTRAGGITLMAAGVFLTQQA